MELPLVSILITSYNRASYIEAAIESALNQTYSNVEIIITDNCSTDGTQVILEKYAKYENVHVYINETNIGQFPNRNKAAMLANGKYLKYLDSDDLLYPHSVSVMVSAMETFPDAGLGISFEIMDIAHPPFPFALEPAEAIRLHYKKGLLFPAPGAIIYKKIVFDEFQGFQDWGLPSDNLLTLKIASKYKTLALPTHLLWWRRHEEQEFNNMSENPQVQVQYYKINDTVLLSKDQPVSKKEAQYFLRCHKTRLCRISMAYLLKGRFSAFKHLLQHTPLSVSDFLISVVPVKYFS